MVVAVGLLSGNAEAINYVIVLPRPEARQMVRESGGAVHSCRRTAPRHFNCRATYWTVRHEGEELEPGVITETNSEPIPEELTVSVGLRGVRF